MSTDRETLLLQARADEVLRGLWNWNYRDWADVADLVADPLAALLARNLSEEELPVTRALLELVVADVVVEDDDTARVRADYVWQEEGGEPCRERIVWVFVREDGRWKAAAPGRE